MDGQDNNTPQSGVSLEGAPAGVTFDMSKQTPTGTAQPQTSQPQQPQQPEGAPPGVTFDMSKMKPLETPTQTPTEPQPQTGVKGFAQDVAHATQNILNSEAARGYKEQTVGGLKNLALMVNNYYKQKLGTDPDSYLHRMNVLGNPVTLLKDAIVDKNHPLHQIAKGLAMSHFGEVKKGEASFKEAINFAKAGDYKNAFESLVQGYGHGWAAGVPGVGPVAGKIGEDVTNNPEYAAGEAGGLITSVLAPGMITKGNVPGEVTPISEETPGLVRPGVQTIAGTEVPVSAPQMAGKSTAAGVEQAPLTTRVASGLGTEQAAQNMINKYTQPAAVEATYSNLGGKAIDEIDALRSVRGETPLPKTTTFDTPADAASQMKVEAQKTYQKLDTAVESDHAAWEKAKAQWENVDNPKPELPLKASVKPTTVQETPGSRAVAVQRFKQEMQSWKDANEAWDAANPEPKSFSELQSDIQKANRTINSNSPAITSEMRNQAIKDLNEAKKQMNAFVQKYPKLVNPDELSAANKLYSEYYKMSELSDKLKPIIRGTTGTESNLLRQPMHINVERLEAIPNELNKEVGWGSGEFEKFMGPERIKNWNDVINALKNPLKGGSSLEQWLPGMFGVLRMPANVIMNRMLFDPEFGRTMLSLWRSGAYTTKAMTQGALSVGRVGEIVNNPATHRYNPATGKVEPIKENEEEATPNPQ